MTVPTGGHAEGGFASTNTQVGMQTECRHPACGSDAVTAAPHLCRRTHTPHPQQVPRLTSVLRALATDHGAKFDADAAFIARQKALEQRQQSAGGASAAAGGGSSAGRSKLAQQLLGDWSKGGQCGRQACVVHTVLWLAHLNARSC